MATPSLSLVLCARNDEYMGNSRWRLETTLNYICAQVARLGRPDAVEIVVADWGSDLPLRDALALDPLAARIVSFVTVPPEVARRAQQDSPFAEVIAINVAARRARGEYIGRIDQDTLVGRHFLRQFLDWVETGGPAVRAPLEGALWFSCRRSIPYRFAVRGPSFECVAHLVRWCGRWLAIDRGTPFYRGGVGIWLLHRDLWDASGGYDERMIYMNDMEIDMATRLMTRYPIIDLGPLVRHDFYHLDHYHPRGPRASSAHRRVNTPIPREDLGLRPSGDAWGLAAAAFDVGPAVWCRPVVRPWPAAVAAAPSFVALVLWTSLQSGVDRIWYKAIPQFRHRWTRRAAIAWRALTGQPLTQWPGLLRKLWMERPSAKADS